MPRAPRISPFSFRDSTPSQVQASLTFAHSVDCMKCPLGQCSTKYSYASRVAALTSSYKGWSLLNQRILIKNVPDGRRVFQNVGIGIVQTRRSRGAIKDSPSDPGQTVPRCGAGVAAEQQ